MGSHARTRKPIYHVHLDPPANQPLSPPERADYWERFEKEFKLENRPYCSVLHVKDGREHEHRAYLAIEPNGKAIRFDHDYARREKLNRIFEIERGEKLTIGAHNKAVINALEKENKHELAHQLRDAGIDKAPKPLAISPIERLQQERTGIDKADVAQTVLTAWQQSDDGKSFAQALQEQRLTLAHGQKCPVIVDSTGNTHALGRLLNLATKEQGIEQIPAPAITERIASTEIPTVQSFQEFRANLPTPTPEKSPTDKGKAEASDVSTSPTKAPSLGGGGGASAPALQVATAQPASAQEAIDGPGEPPGPGASWEQKQAYEKRKIEYEERKNRAEEARRRALAQTKPTTTTHTKREENNEQSEAEKRAIQQASERFASIFSAPRPRQAQPSDTRTEIGRGISENIEADRQARAERGAIQRDRISSEQREKSPSSASTDRAERSGNERDSATTRTDSSTNSDIDTNRKHADITKFTNRKIENTLKQIIDAKQANLIQRMIYAMKSPMTLEQIAQKNVRDTQKKIDVILSTRPAISERDLNRDFQKKKICGELYDKINSRDKQLEKLEKSAKEAESKVSRFAKFFSKIYKTDSIVEAEKAQAEFNEARKNINQENFNDMNKIANSNELAKYNVEQNRKTLEKWENIADIKTAIYTQNLLNNASNTASAGNKEMRDLLAHKEIKKALELQKKLEDAQKAELLKIAQKSQKFERNQSAISVAPSGPKMR